MNVVKCKEVGYKNNDYKVDRRVTGCWHPLEDGSITAFSKLTISSIPGLSSGSLAQHLRIMSARLVGQCSGIGGLRSCRWIYKY